MIVDFEGEWLTAAPRVASQLTCVLVFQVNCPGCFAQLPKLSAAAKKFKAEDVCFVALSTAFEDHEYNTRANTVALLESKTVVGETRKALGASTCDVDLSSVHVVFDRVRRAAEIAPKEREALIETQASRMAARMAQGSLPAHAMESLRQTLSAKPTFATTFDGNGLLGTPSWLIYETASRELVFVTFGDVGDLESRLEGLLGRQ